MHSPMLMSPNGYVFQFIVNKYGRLHAVEVGYNKPTRVVLESPGNAFFEIRVTNFGGLVIHSPPKPDAPQAERVIVYKDNDEAYELLVNDIGVLHLEACSFVGLEPVRLWYASSDFRSGLTDVEASIYLGSKLIASELRLSEIGASGVYSLFYTPIVEGSYIFKINSDTLSSLAIIKRNVVKIAFDNLIADLYNKNAKINSAR